eukprot:2079797-Pyramimonas_sp.AAC.1
MTKSFTPASQQFAGRILILLKDAYGHKRGQIVQIVGGSHPTKKGIVEPVDGRGTHFFMDGLGRNWEWADAAGSHTLPVATP